jgi:U3 small nucleolar RNA-associated protein 12
LEDESLNSFLTLNGHRSEITCVDFNKNGSLMVTGSRDNEIVLWDVVGESGLFRLKGHKAALTSVKFLEKKNIIISRFVSL